MNQAYEIYAEALGVSPSLVHVVSQSIAEVAPYLADELFDFSLTQ